MAEGRYVGPAADRVTFEELGEDFLAAYLSSERQEDATRSHVAAEEASAPGLWREDSAQRILTADVRAFIAKRQEERASNGEINRELAVLKRMFNLGIQGEKIARKPYIPMLAENNARQGFFERAEFEQLLARLPEELRPVATLAYVTGWRVKSEILSLTWVQVDLEAGTVRLYRGMTKNKEGRMVYLFPELLSLFTALWREHSARYAECSLVFHRNGQPIKNFRGSWERACREVGISGRIPHDFRRTAIRNMVRAGIPERVAMMISGHKTRDVFDRYHIVSEGDMKKAAEKIRSAFLGAHGHTFSHTGSNLESVAALSH